MTENNCDPGKTRRKFRCDDLVYSKLYGINIVCDDEEADGYVKLTLDGALVVKASDLTLLLTAEEVGKLPARKGGDVMRKDETTEQAVKRLVRKCGQAVDKLYSRIDDKAAAYDNMGEIVNAVEELAQLALQAERRAR